ncbi:hypothetical protein Vretifemale_9023, partial [Volvox reticuliferus]
GRAMLRALQGRALVREALASAAVVLWAASLLPDVAPGAAAAAFGQGLFLASTLSPSPPAGKGNAAGPVLVYGEPSGGLAADRPLGGWLDDWLRDRGSNLVLEIRRFSPIGRICSLKGLVTAMPKEATCAQLWICAAASPHRPNSIDCKLPTATSEASEAAMCVADPTAAESEEALVAMKATGEPTASWSCRSWHFLIDGALSYGCLSIRDAPDAHFKFHAASVLCFCTSKVLDSWQQHQHQQRRQPEENLAGKVNEGRLDGMGEHVQKDSNGDGCVEDGGGDVSLQLEPQAPEEQEGAGSVEEAEKGQQPAPALQPALLRPDTLETLMGIMWANLDEPLAQTARQLQESFQLLLEVLACQDHYVPGVLPPLEQFKHQVVTQLLGVPANRKGRYASLGFMAERGCALAMLRDHPSLIPETLLAMQSDTTASAASSFLKTLLAAARTEANANHELAVEAAAAAAAACDGRSSGGSGIAASSPWVALWRGALLRVLYGKNEKLRAYVSVHALPVVLGLEPASALEMIHATLADPAPEPVPGTSRVAALVAVLKAARGMGLVADLDGLMGRAGQQHLGMDPAALLTAAVGHASEAVRLDALELACVSFKMSDPPGRLELSIAGRWLSLCMRSTAQGSRNKCLVLVTKLIARIRMAVAHIHNKMGSRGGPAHPSSSKGKAVQVLFSLRPSEEADAPEAGAAAAMTTDAWSTETAILERLQSFMQWLTRLLVSGLYPGSPYERRFFALELLSAVLEAWGPDGSGSITAAEPCGGIGGKAAGRSATNRGGGRSGRVASERQQQGGRMAESTSLTLLPRGYNLGWAVGGTREGGGASSSKSGRGAGAAAASAPPLFRPYCSDLLTSNTVALLLAGAVDSWDKLRQAASSCLMRLPTPLPGLASGEQLTALLVWATGLLWSPRARESDAGARLIKILYGKYVAGRGWRLQLHPVPRALPPSNSTTDFQAEHPFEQLSSYAAVLDFLDAVLDLVNSQVVAAREDLAAACRRSLAHGPLLLLRYVVEDVPWAAVGASREGLAAAAGWAAGALAAAEALVDVALPVLSRPQERNVGAEEVDTALLGDGGSDGEDAVERDQQEGQEEEDGNEGDQGDGCSGILGPEAQVVITACWTTVKEVSLVLATMVRHMPLPTPASSAGGTDRAAAADTDADAADAPAGSPPQAATDLTQPADAANMLTCDQLRRVGELLLRLLFEMKHNGAVDKTSLALTAVSERLLRATAPELHGLPRPWLEACIRRVLAPGQSRDDIVRRSAGLPFALGALFLAEPSNAPKALLSRGMNALLAVAAAATSPYLMTTMTDAAEAAVPTAMATDAGAKTAVPAAVVTVDSFEVRQVWPVVHAFNCLRHTFNDGHLAVDTSGFFAPAIQACLRALRSPSWETRNSAMLCFTALTARVLGFKNDSHGESCRKAVSGTEFFQRYPVLHGFLLAQLREAAAELEAAEAAATAGHGGRAAAAALANPHPGLYPVLIILSRLKTSHIRDDSSTHVQQEQQLQQSQHHADEEEAPAAAAAVAAATATATATATASVTTYMGSLTPVAFTPLVRCCATAAPYAVRRLAAQALGPLVAPQDAPALLQQLLACIPPEPLSDAAAAGPAGIIRIVGSCNTLHGALLQSATLLETAAAETRLDDSSNSFDTVGGSGGDMLRVALPPLARGAWLADPRFGFSALGCALVQAASAALRLLPPSRCLEFRGEVAALTKVCRQAVSFEPPAVRRQRRDGAGGGNGRGSVNVFATDFPDPMRSHLLKVVVQLWLGPVLMCQAFRSSSPSGFFLEGLIHQLRSCLGSYLYDTRAAALKSFVYLLTAINSGAAALSSMNATALQPQDEGNAQGAVPQPATAAVAAALAAGSAGAVGAGSKLPRLVADLLAQPALLRRLVSEGMALLWEAVASEPVHKVIRRALKALGLLHALSITLTATDTTRTPDRGNFEVPTMSPDPITGAPFAIARSPPTVVPAEAAAVALAASEPAAGRWASHPMGCPCCGDPPQVARTAAAAADLTAALSHVALVRRLLTEGCNELEARCEALRCLGRALGSAMLAAASKMNKKDDEGQWPETRSAGAINTVAAVSPTPQPLLAALGSFLGQVETATQPWQPEDWRLAGAEALAASRLLQSAVRAPCGDGAAPRPPLTLSSQQQQPPEVEPGGSSGSLELLAIRGWRCVIAFLEDEDHAVRYTAARLAQEVMELAAPLDDKSLTSLSLTSDESPLSTAAGNSTVTPAVAAEAPCSSSNNSIRSSGGNRDVAVKQAGKGTESTVYGRQPLYVEAVIRRIYPWLATQYGRCDDGGGGGGGGGDGNGVATRTALVEVLCELVSGCSDEDGSSRAVVPEIVIAAAASAGAAGTVGWSSQARRLFDKEADNPHEEPLLTAQIAARTLRGFLAAPQQQLRPDGGSGADGVGNSGSVASTAATLGTAAVLTADGSARLVRWSAVAVEQLSAVAAAVAAASGTLTAGPVAEAGGSGDVDNGPTKDGWLGGFVNHPEVFTCVYKALLVLWTLGPVRQQLLAADATLDDRLTVALQALADRRDVRVSQLAPLLLAVESEWVGGTSLQEAQHENMGKDISFFFERPQGSNMLFLL